MGFSASFFSSERVCVDGLGRVGANDDIIERCRESVERTITLLSGMSARTGGAGPALLCAAPGLIPPGQAVLCRDVPGSCSQPGPGRRQRRARAAGAGRAGRPGV